MVLAFINKRLGGGIPMRVVSFVARVNLSIAMAPHRVVTTWRLLIDAIEAMTHLLGLVRDLDVIVRQNEGADSRVQREAVHALAPREHQLRGATVHAVTSRDQLVARLQNILEAADYNHRMSAIAIIAKDRGS